MSWNIGPGCKVCMHFAMRLEDGTLVDSSFGGEPLQFHMGDGSLVKGLENALYGLWPGDKQTLLIPAHEGYGLRAENNIQVLDVDDFPAGVAKVGSIVHFRAAQQDVPATVTRVKGRRVHVDFNHPLAGHEIQFQVEILAVEPPDGVE